MKWKPLKNYEDFYEISEYGDLKSLKRIHETNGRFGKMNRKCGGKILKTHIAANSYLMTELNFNKNVKKVLIHRLVYSTFIGELKEGFSIHHKDKNKLNNHFSNLEQLDSKTHNSIHSHEPWNKGLKGFRAGEKRDSTIYESRRKKIKCVETGAIFDSIRSASKELNLSESHISTCVKNNKKIRGYFFEYC